MDSCYGDPTKQYPVNDTDGAGVWFLTVQQQLSNIDKTKVYHCFRVHSPTKGYWKWGN